MIRTPRKLVVIGAGIAGLCTAVYARKCGYAVELVEQQESPGGLATSWRRGDYTFETCLHWLVGSAPNAAVHAQWQEVFDVDMLTFVHPDEFVRLENEDGESLSIFADVDRMEAELLRKARQDATQIRHFTSILRRFAKLPAPDPTEPWPRKGLSLLHVLPHLPLLRTLWKLSAEQYGQRFNHKLLRTFFAANSMGQLSLLALIFSLVDESAQRRLRRRRFACHYSGHPRAIRANGRMLTPWRQSREDSRRQRRGNRRTARRRPNHRCRLGDLRRRRPRDDLRDARRRVCRRDRQKRPMARWRLFLPICKSRSA